MPLQEVIAGASWYPPECGLRPGGVTDTMQNRSDRELLGDTPVYLSDC